MTPGDELPAPEERRAPSRVDAVRAPRFRRRFRTRVFTYITVLALGTSVGSAAIYWRQLGFIEKDRSRRARTLLTSLATQAELGAYAGDAALCELAARRTFAEEDVALVAVYDRRGREILHFIVQGLALAPPDPEITVRLLADPDAPPERQSGEDFEDLYAPIVTGARDAAEALATGPGGRAPRREVVGVARVGLSHHPAREQLAEVVRWGVYLAAGILLVGIIAALLISRRVSRPIAELTRGANLIRGGQLDTRVHVESQDELGHLGHAFNRMAARLAETMTALENLNRTLEDQVVRRTEAIQRAAAFTALLNAPLGGRVKTPLTATAGAGAEPPPPPPTELPRISAERAAVARGSATGTLADLLDRALLALVEATGAHGAAALLSDEESVDFELELSWCVGALPAEIGPPPGEEELLLGDAWYDGQRLVVPLRLGTELAGCLVLLLADAPSEERIGFVSHAASQLAIAVGNVRAYAAQIHLARELRERNAALAKQRDQLQEMNRLKSEFLANTSHELRTPLNAILGYTELLGDGIYGPVTDEQRDALAGVDDSSRNLLLLINNILDLSKVESGKITLYTEWVDLGGLIRSVLLEATPLAKDRPYRPDLDAPAAAVAVHTDGTKVKQIVTNLVSNAIKFTAEGEVVVSVRAEPGGGAAIAVRDTGIGIRPEDQRLIFEEFRQVDGSYTRTYGGTGLGLSIARRLAEILGGEITVESQPGVGSTFRLRLPPSPPTGDVTPTPPTRRSGQPPPLPPDAREIPKA